MDGFEVREICERESKNGLLGYIPTCHHSHNTETPKLSFPSLFRPALLDSSSSSFLLPTLQQLQMPRFLRQVTFRLVGQVGGIFLGEGEVDC